MNTLKLKTKNLIRLLILVFLIGTLSACGGFQNQNQQAAGRVNASTAPVVKKTQALSATPTIDRSPATLIEEDIQEAGIEYPQIDSANIMALDVIAGTVHNNPSRVVWALDGQSFGVVNNSQVVRYNARDLAIEAVYAVQEPAYLLDYSPDGHTIAITEDQTSIQFWDIEIIQQISETMPGPFSDAIFLPDGVALAVASLEEIAVQIIEIESGMTTRTITGFDTAAPVYRVKFSQVGDVMMWIARSGVQLMAYPAMEMGPEFYHEDFINDAALHPSGESLAVTTAGTVDGEYAPIIQFWNVGDGSSGGEIVLESVPSSIAFSKDGDLIMGPVGSSIRIWETSALSEVTAFDQHTGIINGFALSPDGRQLVTTADDNKIFLWQVVAE